MRSAALSSLMVVSALASAQAPSEEIPSAAEFPVVLTPTRLRQSLRDVPASVTIITAEMLRRYGILNIPDALRLVPGMAVDQPSGGDYRINYHGSNITTPHRMNVMIDGVSAYQPAFGRVDWDHLPVILDDIERIEVTRGTNSPAYGPNSFLAVVNIITKHPQDVERVAASATVGSLARSSVTGRLGWNIGDTAVRLSVSHDEDGGFDHQSIISGEDHDSIRYDRASFRSQTRFSADTNLDINAGYVGGVRQVPFIDSYQLSYPDMHLQTYYLSGTLTHALSANHEWQLRASQWRNVVDQSWRTCLPAALFLPELFDLWRVSPAAAGALLSGRYHHTNASVDALAAAALSAIGRLGAGARAPICGIPTQSLREVRSDIEWQDTLVVSDQLRLVSGLGARHLEGTSQTYLGGTVSNSLWRAFMNVEYKPAHWLTLNAGGYVERDQLSGSTFSPRIGANTHLSENQTLRFLASVGTRTADIQEQRSNWTYTIIGSQPLNGQSVVRFYQNNIAPGNLRSERINSREIGYLLNVRALGLILDAKIFDDRLYDLISEKFSLTTESTSNDNSVRLRGFEVQANAELSPRWNLFANYAYLRNRDATIATEMSQYAKNSGAVGVSYAPAEGWRGSLAFYGASGDGLGETGYGREDLTISKTFKLGPSDATASFILRHLDYKTSTYYRDAGNLPVSSYNDSLQGYMQLRMSY